MKLFIDNYLVVSSGTVVVVGEQRLRLYLADDFQIDIGFNFENDTPRSIKSEVRDKVLFLTFRNFREGVSNREPMQLGIFSGKPIFLNYVINFIGNDEHHSITFQYSLFSREDK